LVAGLVHVLSGPDHLAAVAPYAVEGRWRAWLLGLRWGLGHASGVLFVGLLAFLLREVFPIARLSSVSERFVGVILIVIGLWGFRRALGAYRSGGHAFAAAKAVNDAPSHGPPARSLRLFARVAFGVGTLHGLAGSSHLLGIAPMLALPTRAASATYLVAFGAGSVMAMACFAAVLGLVAERLTASGRASAKAYPVLLGFCSVAAVVVGSIWLTTAA
jgi:hypothetical protein